MYPGCLQSISLPEVWSAAAQRWPANSSITFPTCVHLTIVCFVPGAVLSDCYRTPCKKNKYHKFHSVCYMPGWEETKDILWAEGERMMSGKAFWRRDINSESILSQGCRQRRKCSSQASMHASVWIHEHPPQWFEKVSQPAGQSHSTTSWETRTAVLFQHFYLQITLSSVQSCVWSELCLCGTIGVKWKISFLLGSPWQLKAFTLKKLYAISLSIWVMWFSSRSK